MRLNEQVISRDRLDPVARTETHQIKLTKFGRAEVEHNPPQDTNAIDICQDDHREQQNNYANNVADPDQPFRLIWTALSFSIGLGGYDKFLNTALDWVRNAARFGGGRNKSVANDKEQQQNGEDVLWKAALEKAFSHQEDPSQVPSKMVVLGFDQRVIFENLNGHINSGELSAILGPSGSGKTSLLNAICGRTQNYTGRIQLVGGGTRRMRLSIIPQKDYLIENLTVRENLLYSSRLLNSGRDFDHEANILRVVRMLNLTTCFQSVAANISGGEYKRVSIAQELLRQPDILILDEPTSGLDSLNCKNLIGSLVKLIRASREGLMKPIAVVMTIHQPDVEIFHMFDHVYCMARGGRVIYDGHPRDALQVIRSQANLTTDQQLASLMAHEGSSKMDSDQFAFSPALNPANLLIEIASESIYGSELIQQLTKFHLSKFEQLHENWSNSDGAQSECSRQGSFEKLQVERNAQELSLSPGLLEESLSHKARQTPLGKGSTKDRVLWRDRRLNAKSQMLNLFWYHTKVLAQRAFVSTLRDKLLTLSSFVFYLSMPFILWLVYTKDVGRVNGCPVFQREFDIVLMASNKTSEKLGQLQDELATTIECSMMFFLTTYAYSMCSMAVAALTFPLNMHILLKEVRNGWYSLPSYVLAKTLASFPFEALFPALSITLLYLSLGMPSSHLEWRLWAMALVMILISMISNTQGLIFGTICMDSAQTAVFLSACASLPQIIVSGFTARIKFMPWALQKLSWLSQFHYSSNLIQMIRYGFNMCPCDETTDKYLRTNEPHFTGVPKNLMPALTYYITNSNNTDDYEDGSGSGNVFGVTSDLSLNETERIQLLGQMESNDLDLLQRLAQLLGRSLSFGRKLDSCASVRPQHLVTFDIPTDEYLALMFGSLFAMLVLGRVLLTVLVNYRIKSRI